MRSQWALVLGGMMLVLPACTYNEEVAYIQCQSCPAALDTQSVSMIDGAASVSTLDRRSWPEEVVVVPTRQIEHPPAVLRARNWFACTPHQRGEYPTAVTALDTRPGAWAAAGEGAINAVSFPVSWVFTTVDTFTDQSGPSLVDRSPRNDEAFERLPPLEWEYAARWIEVGE